MIVKVRIKIYFVSFLFCTIIQWSLCSLKMNGKTNDRNKPQHAGSKSDIPDVDQMIEANPCSQYYMALENCLVESDRSWKKCQNQVILSLTLLSLLCFLSLSLIQFGF